MISSVYSLEDLVQYSRSCGTLARLLSFIQVEEGLSELESNWLGFVDSYLHYEDTSPSLKTICDAFLTAYLEVNDNLKQLLVR